MALNMGLIHQRSLWNQTIVSRISSPHTLVVEITFLLSLYELTVCCRYLP